jgi:hypothetical protein
VLCVELVHCALLCKCHSPYRFACPHVFFVCHCHRRHHINPGPPLSSSSTHTQTLSGTQASSLCLHHTHRKVARIKRPNVPGIGSTTGRSKDEDEREEEGEQREREGVERAVRPRLDDAAPAAPAPPLPPPPRPTAMTQAFEAEEQVLVQQQQEQVGGQQQQHHHHHMGPPQAVFPAAGGPLQARMANQEDGGDGNDMEVDPAMDMVVASRPLSRSSNSNSSSSSSHPEIARPHSASLLLQPSLPSLPVLSPTNNENAENFTSNNIMQQAESPPTTTTTGPAPPSSSSFSPSSSSSSSFSSPPPPPPYLESHSKVPICASAVGVE